MHLQISSLSSICNWIHTLNDCVSFYWGMWWIQLSSGLHHRRIQLLHSYLSGRIRRLISKFYSCHSWYCLFDLQYKQTWFTDSLNIWMRDWWFNLNRHPDQTIFRSGQRSVFDKMLTYWNERIHEKKLWCSTRRSHYKKYWNIVL